MVYCIGHSIISPLGEGSQANFEAVESSRSGLKIHTDRFADVEPFCASLFDTPQDFAELCIRSVESALQSSIVNRPIVNQKNTVFILSTTKGDGSDLWTPAQRIARHFDNPNPPVVVSNACTSGVCAQITAQRLLEAGTYRYAVVIGCDLQSRFIVSGFQALKALSPEPCLPFREERKGLNLGEAAATIIYAREEEAGHEALWVLEKGAIHNDACHISAPSRTGEGAFLCLKDVTDGCPSEDICLLGVHGTATLYNDAMETIAIQRAGLQDVPKSVLKPYFGHTMGAAGVLETILCMMQAEKGGARNGGRKVIKMLSGFGGVNAAIELKSER